MTSEKPSTCMLCNASSQSLPPHFDRRRGLPGRWHYQLCLHCKSAQRSRVFSNAEVNEWYQTYSNPTTKDTKLSSAFSPWKKIARYISGEPLAGDLISVFPEERALEVGCGAANHLISLKEQGAIAFGVDLDPVAIERLFTIGITGTLMPDAKTIPFEEKYFHIVCAMQVIEHVEMQHTFLSELFRVLKPGGICILATPNYDSLSRRIFGSAWISGWFAPYHLCLHSIKSIKETLSLAGFESIEVNCRTPASWFALDLRALFSSPKPDHLESWRTTNFSRILRIIVSLPLYVIDQISTGSCLIVKARRPTNNE